MFTAQTKNNIQQIFNNFFSSKDPGRGIALFSNRTVEAEQRDIIVGMINNCGTFDDLKKLLVYIAKNARQANDALPFKKLRLHVSPFFTCLEEIRLTLINDIKSNNRNLWKQLVAAADTEYHKGQEIYGRAKALHQQVIDSRNEEYQEMTADMLENPLNYLESVPEHHQGYMSRWLARPQKAQFQQMLRQVDAAYRTAHAFGDGNHQSEISAIISKFGIDASEEFYPNGPWWTYKKS